MKPTYEELLLENQRLRGEVGDLHRQLERQQVHASVLGIDAIKKYDASMERFQIERDAALEAVGAYKAAFIIVTHMVNEWAEAAQNDKREIYTKLKACEPLPQLSRLLMEIHERIEAAQIGDINRQLDRYQPTLDSDPLAMFRLLVGVATIAGSREHAVETLRHAYGFAHDPALVADEILRQCRTEGAPNMATLQRLTIQWVRDNLPNAPSKLDTLRLGLTIRQKEIDSGISREAFSKKGYGTPRRLLEYQGWYETLDVVAKKHTSAPVVASSEFISDSVPIHL